ncbi:MAG: oligosaccharide flippase family protein [Nitrospinaceae bacterium]
MTAARSVSRQWLATLYAAVVSMLLTFLLGRVFGPETFGRYSYIITIASLFAILQDGGFRTLLFRELTSPSLPTAVEKLFPIALGHVLAVTGFGVLIVTVLPLPDPVPTGLAVLAFGLGTVTRFISSHLRGQGKFSREAGWSVLVRTITAVGILASLYGFSPKVEWVLAGWVSGYLLSLVFQPYCPLGKISLVKPDPRIYKSLTALVIIDIATLIYFKIDIVMLRHLGPSLQQVGFYAADSRILEGIIFLLLPFANVFFREMRLRSKDPPRLVRFTNRLIGAACLTALIIVPAGLILGEGVLVLCFGEDYRAAAELLHWLFLALAFMIPNLVLTQGALAIDRENYYAAGACAAALLNITLNLFLIPALGAKGAALGTLITEGFLSIFIAAGILSWVAKQGKPKIEPR